MTKFLIFLPDPMLEALRKLAQKRDISVSELVRRAVEAFLKEQK